MMLTAMQKSRHDTTTQLLAAREALRLTLSTICWPTVEQVHKASALMGEIDELLAELLPNEPVRSA